MLALDTLGAGNGATMEGEINSVDAPEQSPKPTPPSWATVPCREPGKHAHPHAGVCCNDPACRDANDLAWAREQCAARDAANGGRIAGEPGPEEMVAQSKRVRAIIDARIAAKRGAR